MSDTLKGYASATQVANFMGIVPNTANLAQITTYLGVAEELVENYCQTTFLQEIGGNTSDLASTQASGWLVVTSATYTFQPTDVGQFIRIVSGTNFTPGVYLIASVAGGNATLSTACGTTGNASSGTWHESVNKIFSGHGNTTIFPGLYIQDVLAMNLLDIDGVSVIYTYIMNTDITLKPDTPLKIASTPVYRWIERKYYSGGSFGQQGGDQSGVTPYSVTPIFIQGSQNIQVFGVWGLPQIPDTIVYAICATVQNMFRAIGINPFIKSEGAYGRSVVFNDTNDFEMIPPMAQRLLDPWVNKAIFNTDGF
ncbi:MAG TPA: hypothetical protein VKR58_05935 [Aquella sp.]|nr:hypothetical protein [Aquella sp.]